MGKGAEELLEYFKTSSLGASVGECLIPFPHVAVQWLSMTVLVGLRGWRKYLTNISCDERSVLLERGIGGRESGVVGDLHMQPCSA